MKLDDLTAFLNGQLRIPEFAADVSNNGLQVEGSAEVEKAVFAVDASLRLFELAAERNADFIFVHHGLSWGSEPRRLTGYVARRYEALFRHNISLYAAHLPLDAAAGFGNNAVLARMMNLGEPRPFFIYDGVYIGCIGDMVEPESPATLKRLFEAKLNCEARFLGEWDRPCRRVAVVSGGGGLEAVSDAAAAGADLLVTGELTHVMHHVVAESGVGVLALGHYASETTGPRALMDLVGRSCAVETEFIDLPTGL